MSTTREAEVAMAEAVGGAVKAATAGEGARGGVVAAELDVGPTGRTDTTAMAVMVAGVATIVGWLKRIGRRARRTINQTLNAMVDETGDTPKDWLSVWERSTR